MPNSEEKRSNFLTAHYSGEEKVHFNGEGYKRLQSLFMCIMTTATSGLSDARSIMVDNQSYTLGFYIDQEEMPGYHLTPNLSPYFIRDSPCCTWDQYGLSCQSFPCCGMSIDTMIDYYMDQQLDMMQNIVRTMIQTNAEIYRFPTIFPFGGCTRLKDCVHILSEGYERYLENVNS